MYEFEHCQHVPGHAKYETPLTLPGKWTFLHWAMKQRADVPAVVIAGRPGRLVFAIAIMVFLFLFQKNIWSSSEKEVWKHSVGKLKVEVLCWKPCSAGISKIKHQKKVNELGTFSTLDKTEGRPPIQTQGFLLFLMCTFLIGSQQRSRAGKMQHE